MFDHRRMTVQPVAQTVEMLRARVSRMEGAGRQPVATHPSLAGLVRLYAGGTYQVDSASLALMLMAGPSRQGAWTAVVGVADLGLEAAAAVGVDLARTVLVPDPGPQWLEATAALVESAALVVLRPPGRVDAQTASRLSARLRKKGTVLVAWGSWPRCDARLSVAASQWTGPGRGDGRLRSRQVVVTARRGAGSERRGTLWLPDDDGAIRAVPAGAAAEVVEEVEAAG